MYVENVVGPDTVNTMPNATLDALLDHGKVVPTPSRATCRRRRTRMRALQEAKISLFDVTHDLQVEGVQLFSDSFAALLGAIVYKQKLLASGGARARACSRWATRRRAYDAALDRLVSADFLEAHLGARCDAVVDAARRTSPIIKKSLGWLDIQQHMLENVAEPALVRETTRRSTSTSRSSAAWGAARSRPTFSPTRSDADRRLSRSCYVLDSTDPQQIKELEDEDRHVRDTLFIISSKSGTTTEPNAFYAYFHEKVSKEGRRGGGGHATSWRSPILGTTLDKEAQGGIGFRADFRQRPEHRRPLLGALVLRHRSRGDRRLRHQPTARPRARRNARQRPARSIREPRPACVSAPRSAASRWTAETSSRSSRIPQ